MEDNTLTNSTKSNRRWSALALIVTAQFMVILDVAIVNVALPSIKSDLHFSATNLQWVISAYAILFGGALLLGGRLADLLGRRRLFMSGLALFAASRGPLRSPPASCCSSPRRRGRRPTAGVRARRSCCSRERLHSCWRSS